MATTYPDYLDFDLELTAGVEAGTFHARVLDSPKGEAAAIVRMPVEGAALENVILKLGRTRSGVRTLGSPTSDLARSFGTQLYDAVFAGEVGTCFRRSLDEADNTGRGLRVRLRLTGAPELADVPWEYLYPAGLGRFLVLSAHTPVVRYLDLPREVPPLRVDAPLRVLLVVSAPRDLATLDGAAEVARIEAALADLTARGLVHVTAVETATLAELRRLLRRDTFHILHFIGHGGFDARSGEGMLAFEDDSGSSKLVSGTDLGTLLHDHRTLRLAVLNACEGARQSPTDPFSGVAQSLIRQGLPAVVAMQFEITDAAATTFSQEFYAAMADGYPIDAALAQGRMAVFSSDNDVEWGTPVLYLRAQDGRIFDVTAPPLGGPAVPEAEPAAATLASQSPAPAPVAARAPEPAPPVPVIPVVPLPEPPTEAHARPDDSAHPDAQLTTEPRPFVVEAGAGVGAAGSGGASGAGGGRRWVAIAAAGVVAVVLGVVGVKALGSRTDIQRQPQATPTVAATSSTPGRAQAGSGTPVVLTPPGPLVAVRGTPSQLGTGTGWEGAQTVRSSHLVFGTATGTDATWRLMWDDEALYLLVDVTDDSSVSPDPNQPSQAFKGDSVSLELGPARTGLGPKDGLRPQDAHYLFGTTTDAASVVIAVNPSDPGGNRFVAGGPRRGVEAVMRTTETGYWVEAKIAWSATGMSPPLSRQATLAANLNVSDAAADGSLRSMSSTNPIRTAANQVHPGLWHELQLVR